jgi:hypothetical protein
VLPSELRAVPWPALLVSSNGAVLAASPAAVALIGMCPGAIAEVEDRFELLSAGGKPFVRDERPLRRVTRAELFEVAGIWRDRVSGRELSLRFRGRAVGAYGLLEIDSLAEDAERRATERLSKLNEALLGRTPGEGLISIRELLLQLVLLSCELTGARYGALGVLNPDGASLKDFVYVGIPEETARKIGQLPRGKGLLGAVIHERATIRVAEAGGGATLSVHDEGPGISPEDLPRLFDRYFQTERARAKRQGLGLGLFITKGLVEAHGGTITVESEPGAGSTFRVWLPAAQRKA